MNDAQRQRRHRLKTAQFDWPNWGISTDPGWWEAGGELAYADAMRGDVTVQAVTTAIDVLRRVAATRNQVLVAQSNKSPEFWQWNAAEAWCAAMVGGYATAWRELNNWPTEVVY